MSGIKENCKRNRDKISQSISESILEEQAIMFGPMISTLFDCFHEAVETVIEEGVSTLPFLPSSDHSSPELKGKDVLIQILRESYTKNMYMAELYAVRNIFAIPNSFTKKCRSQILSSFQKERDNVEEKGFGALSDRLHNQKLQEKTKEYRGGRDDASTRNRINMPKDATDIPTNEQIDSLDSETRILQSKLFAAKKKKRRLKEQIEDIDKSLEYATEAEKRFGDINLLSEKDNTKESFEKIQESVSAAIMGQEAIRNLCAQGKALIKKMDEDKNKLEEENGNKNNVAGEETKEFSDAMKQMSQSIQESERARKNKPPSLDKDFEERKKKAKIVLKESKVGAFTKFLKR